MNAYTQISEVNQLSLSYSPSGNLIEDEQGNSYVYDYDNRLIEVNGNVSYQYDALGRRYKKTVSGNTYTYYYYQSQVIEEVDGNNSIKEFIYAGTVDYLICMINNGQQYFFHYNSLGSIVGLSNSSGNVVERYAYSPYGEVSFFDGGYGLLSESQIGNDYLYTGRRFDSESGLYYFRNRYYNPRLGRFHQFDPISFEDGMNLYQYVHSNPINNVDPLGLSSCFSFSKEYSFDLQKSLFAKLLGASNKSGASIKFELKIENCRKCCEEKKSYGTATELSFSGSFSASFPLNVLDFIPQTKPLVAAADKVGLEVFFGAEFSVSAGGSVNGTNDECGKKSGGGCISAGASVNGILKADTNETVDKYAKIGAGGSLGGGLTHKACRTCSNKSCKWDCSTSWKSELKFWLQVEFSFESWSYTWLKIEYNQTLSEGSSNGCIIPLPSF